MAVPRIIQFLFIIIILGLQACEEKKNPYFSISSDQVGLISRHTSMEEAENLYSSDSVVKDSAQFSIGVGKDKLKIFAKGGTHLFTLTQDTDSIQQIGHVLIADPRFTTEKGIGLQSTFKEIKLHYTIDKVVTSMNNVVVLLKESDIYFTIDKKELPAHLRYTKTRPVELVEIPDKARIKYLMVGWD
ncbi:MAG: hypothetical protein ACR2MM_01265 [Flavobacteriaceae bacterium]